MKFNLTHALLGLGALYLLVQAAKKSGTVTKGATPGQATAQAAVPAEWWTYAGNWA